MLSLARPFRPPRVFDSAVKQQHGASSHLLAARTLFCPCSSAGVPDRKAWGCLWIHPFSLLQINLICSNSKSLQRRQRQGLEPQSGSLPTHGKAQQQRLHWQVEESPLSFPS